MTRAPWTVLAATCAIGCTHGGLDRRVSHGSPTTASVEDVPVKGFSVEVETTGVRIVTGSYGPTSAPETVSGELLAVDGAGIYVLTDKGTRLVPANQVREVSVELYDSGGAWMGAWTAVGTLSTISHGLFLIITAPTWLVAGSATAGGSGLANDLNVKPGDVVSLWQFARFPAGLPPPWPGVGHPAPLPPGAAPTVILR